MGRVEVEIKRVVIRRFGNEKRIGAVTGDALDSYWPFFPQSPGTVPEVFAKVSSAQFPCRILSGE